MPNVAIVTDSTAGIPIDYLTRYQITVAPQVLIWGEETYEDGVDIRTVEYYQRLATTKVMPTTSQVTINSFKKIFEAHLDAGREVLAVLISHTLSGTYDSAIQARDMLPPAPIEIVDTGTVAMPLGFAVLESARAAEAGASLAECKRVAEQACRHTGVVFAVNTLEFLHRGGRIGGGSRFLGTALNIKPILEVVDGKVQGIERVRTRQKSLKRIIELIEDRIGDRRPIHIATIHANVEKEAREFMARVNERLQPAESVFSELSPVVGTHAGPGTIGLAFMAGFVNEAI